MQGAVAQRKPAQPAGCQASGKSQNSRYVRAIEQLLTLRTPGTDYGKMKALVKSRFVRNGGEDTKKMTKTYVLDSTSIYAKPRSFNQSADTGILISLNLNTEQQTPKLSDETLQECMCSLLASLIFRHVFGTGSVAGPA